MKKRDNPELVILGVENTKTEGDEIWGVGGNHYCHKNNEFESHIDNRHTGHYKNNGCKETHWNEAKDSKCCCKEDLSVGVPNLS